MNPGRTATRKADFGGYRRQRGGRGPGLRQGRVFRKQTVGEARGNEHGVEAALFRGFRYLPQVFESWRAVGPDRAGARAITVNGYKPVETRFRTESVASAHTSPVDSRD